MPKSVVKGGFVRFCSTAAVALFALSLGACENSGVDPTAAPVTSVLLTDAPFPFDRVARVDVYVVSLQAAENADTGAAQAGLVAIVAPRRRFNLLELQAGATVSLGDTTIPAALFRSVKLTIDTDSSSVTMRDGSVLTGTTTPGVNWQGSGEIPLNALVHDFVEITDTGAVVVIDFDLGNSFLPWGADTIGGATGFLFTPHIRAVNSAESGSVSGIVVAADDGAPIPGVAVRAIQGNPDWPENTWSTLSSGNTDANGEFRLAYLWPRTYIMAVDAPRGSPFDSVRVANVAVNAGDEISLGTLALPRR